MNVLDWALNAAVGERVVYAFRTAAEIEYCVEGGRFGKNLGTAMQAHREGLVFLAQRRKGTGFEYEATRISRPVAKMLKIGEYAR